MTQLCLTALFIAVLYDITKVAIKKDGTVIHGQEEPERRQVYELRR
ncbi:hypothetical protein [Lacrimispora xylanisolvens]